MLRREALDVILMIALIGLGIGGSENGWREYRGCAVIGRLSWRSSCWPSGSPGWSGYRPPWLPRAADLGDSTGAWRSHRRLRAGAGRASAERSKACPVSTSPL
jgi:hypothetical protein